MTAFIIDVNILFSGVLSQNELYKNLFSSFKFYTPDFALIELNKYRELILKKTLLKSATLKEFTLYVFSEIVVVPNYVISQDSYNKAKQLCISIDQKDVAYVGLSIEFKLDNERQTIARWAKKTELQSNNIV